jgi:DNA transformation protein
MADPLVAHTLELLAPLGAVRARRMFGGHGFYLDELFVALIADGRLYLKADAQTADEFSAAGSRPFVYTGGAQPVTMSYWSAPDEALESPAAMAPWARRAVAAALRARALSTPRKARRPGAAAAATPDAAPPRGPSRRAAPAKAAAKKPARRAARR